MIIQKCEKQICVDNATTYFFFNFSIFAGNTLLVIWRVFKQRWSIRRISHISCLSCLGCIPTIAGTIAGVFGTFSRNQHVTEVDQEDLVI